MPQPLLRANEAQWAGYEEAVGFRAHDALGQAADSRKKYPEAIKQYQEALEVQPTNSVVTARLAKAYVGNKQYDEAIATADKVAAMSDAPSVVKQFAQQQKDAATKLKGTAAKCNQVLECPQDLSCWKRNSGTSFETAARSSTL